MTHEYKFYDGALGAQFSMADELHLIPDGREANFLDFCHPLVDDRLHSQERCCIRRVDKNGRLYLLIPCLRSY